MVNAVHRSRAGRVTLGRWSDGSSSKQPVRQAWPRPHLVASSPRRVAHHRRTQPRSTPSSICCGPPRIAAGPTGTSRRTPPRSTRLPEGVSRAALVVGGGLAGLSAALELAEAGYAVTIREGSDVLGGRIATRDLDPGIGRTFRVEHGLHMWFDNYWVFKDLRRRLEIDHHFRPYSSVYFKFRNYEDELLESKPHVFPFNLLRLVDASPEPRPRGRDQQPRHLRGRPELQNGRPVRTTRRRIVLRLDESHGRSARSSATSSCSRPPT